MILPYLGRPSITMGAYWREQEDEDKREVKIWQWKHMATNQEMQTAFRNWKRQIEDAFLEP